MQQVEITLKDAILTWSSMDSNIGIVGLHVLAMIFKTEVVTVDRRLAAIW